VKRDDPDAITVAMNTVADEVDARADDFAAAATRAVLERTEWQLPTRMLAGYAFSSMQPLNAHVLSGRLMLDEPTDLPDGTEVDLILVEDKEFESEERARLLQAIEAGAEDIERGDYVDGMEFADDLLTRRRETSSR